MSKSHTYPENSLKRWLPNTSISALRDEMADLMENFFGDAVPSMRNDLVPRVDVAETANAVEITTDVPGYKREDIQVEVDDKSLTISGCHSEEKKEEDANKKYHRLERRCGSFSRTVWLPCAVDDKQIDARISNGVLRIQIPKSAESCRRKVEIQDGDHPSSGSTS